MKKWKLFLENFWKNLSFAYPGYAIFTTLAQELELENRNLLESHEALQQQLLETAANLQTAEAETAQRFNAAVDLERKDAVFFIGRATFVSQIWEYGNLSVMKVIFTL